MKTIEYFMIRNYLIITDRKNLWKMNLPMAKTFKLGQVVHWSAFVLRYLGGNWYYVINK
jgi:hypothetical protein